MNKRKKQSTAKKLLRDHRGDVYIQMVICTTIMLLVSVVMFTVSSSVTTKMWLDEKLDDIAKNVSTSGTIDSTMIKSLESEIQSRFGGTIYYTLVHDESENAQDRSEHEALFTDEKKVQLNDKIIITYHSDKYTAINIAELKIETPINLTKSAISQVYYKTNDSALVDP